MDKLLIIDGSNLLFQMFFGMPSRIINGKGKAVQQLETDDIIAGYAYAYGEQMSVVIASFDSDFFQLINENIKVLRYRGKNTVVCDSDYIKEKLGIAPFLYADFKSLTGDSSDNIKGADKIGPKTAARLLHEFGDLESILENSDSIERPSIKESIVKNAERLRTNYKLIKLGGKAVIPFSISELEYNYSGITTNEVLNGIGLK